MERRWIDLEGLANLRDVGGIPTLNGGMIRPGRLLRSDNLQDLTERDVQRLLQLGLTDVIDLRSDYEAENEGPGPLTTVDDVHIQQHSLFREWREGVGEDKPDERPDAVPEEALPWVDLEPTVQVEQRVTSFYLSYLSDRPDSVLAALRGIANADGAALVHCAAGKDRTGTIVAMALMLVGADPAAVVDDYAASGERMQAIVDRLVDKATYAANMRDRPLSSHMTYPETMQAFLDYVVTEHGTMENLLQTMGWTEADTKQLRAKLLD